MHKLQVKRWRIQIYNRDITRENAIQVATREASSVYLGLKG